MLPRCTKCPAPSIASIPDETGKPIPVCYLHSRYDRPIPPKPANGAAAPAGAVPGGLPAAGYPREGVGEFAAVVVDGDTLAIAVCPTCALAPHVRLLGIDAPERTTNAGKAATAAAVASLLAVGGKVRLEPDAKHPNTDRWGRLLRHAWCGGKLLAAELVRGGFAVVDRRFPQTLYEKQLAAAEEEATAPVHV